MSHALSATALSPALPRPPTAATARTPCHTPGGKPGRRPGPSACASLSPPVASQAQGTCFHPHSHSQGGHPLASKFLLNFFSFGPVLAAIIFSHGCPSRTSRTAAVFPPPPRRPVY
eukprot:EG_transcript_27432